MSFSSPCDAPERRRVLLAALAGVVAARSSWGQAAPPAEVDGDLPGARLRGEGRLRFFGLHVYDALLWATQPLHAVDVERAALALELRYARMLRGGLIAERSITEMRRVGSFDDEQAQRWLAVMKQLFPDVNAGDRITGVHRPGEGARFHVNGRLVGEVRDPLFARLFFGIWLSPRTSEPQLRAALLGSGG
jgi:hypothetical protein